MKRPLTILTIAVLTILVIIACSSTIRTASTSFVTITIGGDARKATLHAEGATPWVRFKYFLADAKLISEAYAYIPSVVQVLVVTVSADDMTTSIVGSDSIKPDQTTSTIRIEAPNGTGRKFTVEGIRGVDSNTYYRGTATTDLSGLDVTLDISMAFVGPGILVDTLHSQATDTAGCGTAALPCKTITYALNSRTTGTDAIIVSAGTYTAGESYPLQLKPGTALICTGTGYSTVIDQSQSPGMVTFYGNEAASIDNCQIIPAADGRAIDDQTGGGTPSRMKINGVLIPSPGVNQGAWEAIYLTADSMVIESTIQNSNNFGIEVASGKPAIKNTTLSGNPTGIEISGGDPVISDNQFTVNTIGINIVSSGKPNITTSIFDANGIGLSISAGNAEVSSSTFINNTTGIDISGGSPRIQTSEITGNSGSGVSVAAGSAPIIQLNRIHCNFFVNMNSLATTTIDVRNNFWENAPPIVSDTLSGCLQGTDICYDYLGQAPEYQPYGAAAAVPGSCVRAIAKPR